MRASCIYHPIVAFSRLLSLQRNDNNQLLVIQRDNKVAKSSNSSCKLKIDDNILLSWAAYSDVSLTNDCTNTVGSRVDDRTYLDYFFKWKFDID